MTVAAPETMGSEDVHGNGSKETPRNLGSYYGTRDKVGETGDAAEGYCAGHPAESNSLRKIHISINL